MFLFYNDYHNNCRIIIYIHLCNYCHYHCCNKYCYIIITIATIIATILTTITSSGILLYVLLRLSYSFLYRNFVCPKCRLLMHCLPFRSSIYYLSLQYLNSSSLSRFSLSIIPVAYVASFPSYVPNKTKFSKSISRCLYCK